MTEHGKATAANYRLLFIDDHPIYCEGLAYALSRRVSGLKVFTVDSGEAALKLLAHKDVDLVLSDYRLPGEDGLEVLRKIASAHPSIALGILCADVTPLLVQRAQGAGAVACLSKHRDMTSIAAALDHLLDGQTVFDAEPPVNEQYGISDRRLSIIQMACEGLSNKHIACRLDISERTVKDHWRVIFERLGADNRAGAVNAALSHGLIEVQTADEQKQV